MTLNRRDILQSLAAGGAIAATDAAQAQFGWMQGAGQGQGRGQGGGPRHLPFPKDSPAIMYHHENCERCGMCVLTCSETQKIYDLAHPDVLRCIHCGQCVANCYDDGVTERFQLQEVFNLMDENRRSGGRKKFVALVAPAVRATLGEMFKLQPGANVEGQTVTALRTLGFDYVLDVTFGADLTVMEEAAELEAFLAGREAAGSEPRPPMFTSCCPAWVQFVEQFYPQFRPQVSTCKSPIMMQSALVKTFFAQREKIPAQDVVAVAVTPCTAKKFERTLDPDGYLDFALTTRELGWWLSELRVPFAELEPGKFDSMMGRASGAGVLFGNTGGVTEAVLRSLYFRKTGKTPPAKWLTTSPVRGIDGMRKAEVNFGDGPLRIAIVHGIGVAHDLFRLLERVEFDFVEVMACRGGCIGGGGTPKLEIPVSDALRARRMSALYAGDTASAVRVADENPEIQQLYDTFLKRPGNPLLHVK